MFFAGEYHKFITTFRSSLLPKARSKISLCNMEVCNFATELSSKISVLDGVRWIASTQKYLSFNCVKNCFIKAGFVFEMIETETQDPTDVLHKINDIRIHQHGVFLLVLPKKQPDFNDVDL